MKISKIMKKLVISFEEKVMKIFVKRSKNERYMGITFMRTLKSKNAKLIHCPTKSIRTPQ